MVDNASSHDDHGQFDGEDFSSGLICLIRPVNMVGADA